MDRAIAGMDPGPCRSMDVQPVPHDENRAPELTLELTKETEQVVCDSRMLGEDETARDIETFFVR
jgi:hypothetical protein